MKPKQSSLWLLAALGAPVAHFSGCGWLTALVTAAAVLPLGLIRKDWSFTKPLALVQIIWLGIVAGSLLPASAVCWPTDNTIAVPLTLLTLAALTGAGRAPRIGAVLAFAMGLLAMPIALAGAAKLEAKWLSPTPLAWEPMLAVVFLLSVLPAGGEEKGRGILSVGILTAVLSLLVQGVLSPGVATSLQDPEYQTARTLGYLEPVAAAALTLGWYSMASWLFGSAAEIAKNSHMEQWLSSVLLWGTIALGLLFECQLWAPFLVGLSAFLWCFTPFFQKMKKVKNSA